MQPSASLDVPIVHALYELYRVWHQLLLNFPKSQRYSLGQTTSGYILAVLEGSLAAASTVNAADKLRALRGASIKLDALRLLVRLAKDCSCITNQAYLDVESQLHTTGRMLGGWIKSVR